MQTMQTAIMGFFQGLTEFLPVSSSGHIVVSSALYKILTGENMNAVSNEEIFFDILVHLATLFAIFIYFWNDIKNIFCGFLRAMYNKDFSDENFLFGINITAATIVTCLFGLLIKDFVHKLTQNPFIVSIFIITTGCILLLSEKFKRGNSKMNFKTALMVGLFQGFAIFPGLSRSGLTISSAIYKGVSRVEAAKFSFILSIPIILTASLFYPLLTFDLSTVKNFNFTAIMTGMAISFITGYFCIKYFMIFLKQNTLRGFGLYCILAGAIFALIFAG